MSETGTRSINGQRQALRCKATNSSGAPCGKWAMEEQLVCATHGGRAPQNQRKALERIAERDARLALARLGHRSVDNPLEVLAQLAAEAEDLVTHWRAKVDELKDDERYSSSMGTEQLRAEVELYERALDRAERFNRELAKLNLDERLVRIDEAKAALCIAAIAAAVDTLDLTPDKRQAFMARVAEEFTRRNS